MQLIEIDKVTYRKHLNIVIVGFIITLLVLALIFAQVLIMFFSETIASATSEAPNNFKFNFLGVLLSLLACGAILHSLKKSAFFKEIYYVWQIKQLQNSIYRKLKKIKRAAKEGDKTALTILLFYYQSQKQIYLLDDNTLTLSSLEKDITALHETIANNNDEITCESFDRSLLASYK